ncbi:hypothetical protein WJX74_004091 [Apatococcus lobatus]|uniref:FAD synthase n=2 Tax=Apatococcus TaxID=904362 RepID=A0AAW1QWQ4_9CHLO
MISSSQRGLGLTQTHLQLSAAKLAKPYKLCVPRRHRRCCCSNGEDGDGEQLVQHCSMKTWNTPLTDPANPDLPPIVALGKFDAMHKGHRALCMQAAQMGGQPWMMSFSGMGEVLGWPARLSLVADSDRPRILAAWTQDCRGHTPRQRYVPFAAVRHLQPEDFVAMLAEDLQVAGVVVGENYRFGYKARGDAKLLQELGQQHGISVAITELLGAGVPGRVGEVPTDGSYSTRAYGGDSIRSSQCAVLLLQQSTAGCPAVQGGPEHLLDSRW